ncbi:unnamed protein product [Durusdinium trenchii]|uniref:Uncharacterized protein n=2 Tax=Durusdinium trenchii TaxID=1381693 RepID=A0ABP0QN73_9DINO
MFGLLSSLGEASRTVAAPVYMKRGDVPLHTPLDTTNRSVSPTSRVVYRTPSTISSPSIVQRSVSPLSPTRIRREADSPVGSPSVVYRAVSPVSSPSNVRTIIPVSSPTKRAASPVSSPGNVYRAVSPVTSPGSVYRAVSPATSPSNAQSVQLPQAVPVPAISPSFVPVLSPSLVAPVNSPSDSPTSNAGLYYTVCSVPAPVTWVAPLPGEVPISVLQPTLQDPITPRSSSSSRFRSGSVQGRQSSGRRRAPPPFSPQSSKSTLGSPTSRTPSKQLRRGASVDLSDQKARGRQDSTSIEPLHHTYSQTFRDGDRPLPGGRSRSSRSLSRSLSRSSSRDLLQDREHPCHRLSRASTASFRMKQLSQRRGGGSKSRSASPSARSATPTRSATQGWFPTYQPLQHGYVSKHVANASWNRSLRDRALPTPEAPLPFPVRSKNMR